MRKVSTRAPNLQSWRQTVSIRLVASCSSWSQYWLSLALRSSRHSQLLPVRQVARFFAWGVVRQNGFSCIVSVSVTVFTDSYVNVFFYSFCREVKWEGPLTASLVRPLTTDASSFEMCTLLVTYCLLDVEVFAEPLLHSCIKFTRFLIWVFVQ